MELEFQERNELRKHELEMKKLELEERGVEARIGLGRERV